MIDGYATEPHYLDHLWPVVVGLGTDGGHVYRGGAAWPTAEPIRASDRPTLVASWWDSQRARRLGRPVVYLEHGAGQTYATEHPSYSGGGEHDGTRLFLSPSEEVADRWRSRYPGTPAVAVGCPKLDARHRAASTARETRRARGGRPTVAISFHSNAPMIPETAGAFNEWRPHLRRVVGELTEAGWDVIGHSHPRLWSKAGPAWAAAGAEPVRRFPEVLDRADVYVADNTSTLPEAASCGIPLVFVWAPWWRAEEAKAHGGRFEWWVGGQEQIDRPGRVVEAVVRAYRDPPEAAASRAAMVRRVYRATDGRATERAVDAIRQHVLGR